MAMDKCEICNENFGKDINVLPIKKTDGSYITLACNKCAEASAVFCKIHQRPHTGFEGGGTACIQCINEKTRNESEIIFKKFSEAIKDSKHKKSTLGALEKYSILMEEFGGWTYQQNIARVILTFALRKKKKIEDVIKKISEEGLAGILPKDIPLSLDF